MMLGKFKIRAVACLLLVILTGSFTHADGPAPELMNAFLPWAKIVAGTDSSYGITAQLVIPIDGADQTVDLKMNRIGEEFDLEIAHSDYAVTFRRRADEFALILPRHQTAYVSHGKLDGKDTLHPERFLKYVCGPGTQANMYLPLLSPERPDALVKLVLTLSPLKHDSAEGVYRAGDHVRIRILPGEEGLKIDTENASLKMLCSAPAPLAPIGQLDGMKVTELPRAELESQIARGCQRAGELFFPSTLLTAPRQTAQKVPHGELRWIDGQRVVLLSGTPEQIGTAHGQLLKEEAMRCLDSVLNVFGTLQTVRTGRWFRHDLHDASVRLLPHIPERHRQETRALAVALNLDPQFVEELNVFPELFHCSGFAVFGSATEGGKLYHGRVLDYMTMIGLQDCATTFIIAADGQIPFANVGYAAFIGSVSGMNLQTISLGEMGGKGEGQWDGVPMATLMRRALEECSTLEEVMTLWKNNPRTCEYYYVFAEGKTRRAVGVAAVPESVEFVLPGADHPRLGTGIPDTVVLSAGTRLEALRARVQEKHGKIDAEVGQWLMCRPVAMKSNLHNVLFVPEDGVFYVANADHRHPAAERPYVKLNLPELVKSMQ